MTKARGGWLRVVWRLTTITLATLLITLVFALGMLSLTQITAPGWVRTKLEDQLVMAAQGGVAEVETIHFSFDLSTLSPTAILAAVRFQDVASLEEIRLTDVQLRLDTVRALAGEVDIKSASIRHASIIGAIGSADGGVAPQAGLPGSDLLGEFSTRLPGVIGKLEVSDFSALIRLPGSGHEIELKNGRLALSELDDAIAARAEADWLSPARRGIGVSATLLFPVHRGGFDLKLSATGAVVSDFSEFLPVATRILPGDTEVNLGLELSTDGSGGTTPVTADLEIGAWQTALPGLAEPVTVNSLKTQAEFSLAGKQVAFRDINVDSSIARLTAEADFHWRNGAGEPAAAEGRISVHDAEFLSSPLYRSGLRDVSAAAELRARFAHPKIEFSSISLQAGDNSIESSGTLEKVGQDWVGTLEFNTGTIGHAELVQLWPDFHATAVREWIRANVNAGSFHSANGGLRMHSEKPPDFMLNFQFLDADINVFQGVPSISGGSGFAVLQNSDFDLKLEQGWIADDKGNRADISDSEFSVRNIGRSMPISKTRLVYESEGNSLLTLLSGSALLPFDEDMLSTDLGIGAITGTAILDIPIKRNLSRDEIGYSADAEIHNISISDSRNTGPFESGLVKIHADNSGIQASAEGSFRGIPVSGNWAGNLSPEGGRNQLVKGKVELSQKFFENFGVPVPAGTIRGSQQADYFILLNDGAAPEFGISVDAEELAVEYPLMSILKPYGESAEFLIEGQLSDPIRIRRLVFSTKDFSAEGAFIVDSTGDLVEADVSRLEIGNWLKTSVQIQSQGGFAATLRGGSVDLRNAGRGGRLRSTLRGRLERPVRVLLDQVLLTSNVTLTDLEGTILLDNDASGEFLAKINGEADVRITISIDDANQFVNFSSGDAGAVLRAMGTLRNIQGGRLQASVAPRRPDGRTNLSLNITDTRVRQMPLLGEILNVVSLFGLTNLLDNNGILFSEVKADISLIGGRMEIRNGSAVGPALGATMEGYIDRDRNQIELEGALTPFNTANEAIRRTPIQLIGLKEGEGLGAVSYSIRGSISNPEAIANPLTALTPGILKKFIEPIFGQ
ncbi:MAG: DUF3971 domain-containing protein [Rhodobacteraceae bacterium]|nr:DUF3971 domain-containing protein [Paracoccaceae bacterium]